MIEIEAASQSGSQILNHIASRECSDSVSLFSLFPLFLHVLSFFFSFFFFFSLSYFFFLFQNFRL